MVIEISELRKSYKIDGDKVQEVLRGVSFSVGRGELAAVVGESGSGKSTLLNIIGGLDSDFEGSVKVFGKELRELKALDDYRKLRIGFIFQSFNLIPTYTVLENILTPAVMTNMSDKQKKARNLIERLGLTGLESKRPSSLSGGERQRVAIARALMNDPDIILADEPTGALDKENAANIIALLKEIASEGKTVIAVTHSEIVAGQCHRVIRMGYGVIAEDSGSVRAEITEQKKKPLTPRRLGYLRALASAYKNVRKNKIRNILVSVGTGIGIFSVVILLFLSRGIGGYVEARMLEGNDPLLIDVTKTASSGRRFASFAQAEPFSESEIGRLEELEGISEFEKASVLTGSVSLSAGEVNSNLAVLSTLTKNITPDLKAGAMPLAGEILLSESAAGDIMSDYSKLIGETVTLEISEERGVLTAAFIVSGVIENSGSVSDRFKTGYILYEDLNAMYGAEEPPPISTVYIRAADDVFAARIKSELSALGFNTGGREVAVNRIVSVIRTVTAGLTGIAAVSLVVSDIMIIVVLFISVVERTREIGTLRALGARASDIRRVFMMEGGLLGAGGGIVGAVLAAFLGFAANFITMRYAGVRLVSINLSHMASGFIIGLAVSIPASILPASKASKLDPVESLRHE